MEFRRKMVEYRADMGHGFYQVLQYEDGFTTAYYHAADGRVATIMLTRDASLPAVFDACREHDRAAQRYADDLMVCSGAGVDAVS